AAVVLGGTSLAGGRGSVVATAVGALFLSQLDQVLLASGSDSAVQNLIQGSIVALGMGLRNVPWARLARSGRLPGAGGGEPRVRPSAASLQPTRGATAPLMQEEIT
ncbi:MAG TPA: hypothetical protein VGO71_04705, partial [Baekduia sp.]|nr:hypothetical protein [Baekduia sp.]